MIAFDDHGAEFVARFAGARAPSTVDAGLPCLGLRPSLSRAAWPVS